MNYLDYAMMLIEDGVDVEEALDITEDQFGLDSAAINRIYWELENLNIV